MDRYDPPNVLLLGVSYPDVKGQMDKHGYSEKLLAHKNLSVDQAIELACRGILTEMDARDLARCVATENIGGGLKAYTVSKEVGGVYRSDRHVYANFNNSRGLYNALTQNFGPIQFQQVILDYYWMPTVRRQQCPSPPPKQSTPIHMHMAQTHQSPIGTELTELVVFITFFISGMVSDSMVQKPLSKHSS
jgi:hypothetical protein